MWKWFYQDSTMLNYPLAALALFVALFSVATLWAWKRYAAGERLDAVASMPLDDDHEVATQESDTSKPGGHHV